jgi:two-component system NarL family sensor kinase
MARQELTSDGNRESTGLARAREGVDRTLSQLRQAAFELHPYALDQAGLAAGIQQVAEQQGDRGGYATRVTVARDAAGIHDELVFAIARELLVNAAKHANASFVSVGVKRSGKEIVLEVADDGEGIDPQRRAAALLEGHIGLASIVERVESIGGRVSVSTAPGIGTTVSAALPMAARSPA